MRKAPFPFSTRAFYSRGGIINLGLGLQNFTKKILELMSPYWLPWHNWHIWLTFSRCPAKVPSLSHNLRPAPRGGTQCYITRLKWEWQTISLIMIKDRANILVLQIASILTDYSVTFYNEVHDWCSFCGNILVWDWRRYLAQTAAMSRYNCGAELWQKTGNIPW